MVEAFVKYARPMGMARVVTTPFPLGRPLGAPGAAAVQRRVLVEAFDLVDTATGPTVRSLDLPYRG